MAHQADAVGAGPHPPLLFAGTLIGGLLLQRLVPLPFVRHRIVRLIGLAVAGLGLILGISGLMTMRRAGTNPDPNRPVSALVTTGPFRYTRNPLYISMALMHAGVGLLTGALWALLLLPIFVTVIDRRMILREEQYLARRFGEEYTTYQAQVRRWL